VFSLGRRLLRRRIRNEPEAPADPGGVPVRTTPALMLLVPDASGLASYRAETFFDVKFAEEFLEYWFPEPEAGGVIAFWALTWEPSGDQDGDRAPEPLVLIRDNGRQNVVYVFSFPDQGSAEAFLREALSAGIDLSCVSLYWAQQVAIETVRSGGIRLSPARPPTRTAGDQPTEAGLADTRVRVAAELRSALWSHRAMTEAWTAVSDALFSALTARQALIKACRAGAAAITHAARLHAARLDMMSERRHSGGGSKEIDPEALLAIAEALRIISEHRTGAIDDVAPEDGPAYSTRNRDHEWSPSIEEIIRELDRFRSKYRPDWPERPLQDPDESGDPDTAADS
jgi:hypothetical protein